MISAGVTVSGKTTPSGKFNEEASKELDLVSLEGASIWSEETLDFFGIGERIMELASAAAGGGAVSVGVSDCGGFVWIRGSVGGTGTSAAVAVATG